MEETQLHIKYCETLNIPLSELKSTQELQGKSIPAPERSSNLLLRARNPTTPTTPQKHVLARADRLTRAGGLDPFPRQTACTAYTRYVLDVGQSQDWLALQVALAPCLLGYGAVARMLCDDAATKRDGNPYWSWIEAYVSDEYFASVKVLSGPSLTLAIPLPPCWLRFQFSLTFPCFLLCALQTCWRSIS